MICSYNNRVVTETLWPAKFLVSGLLWKSLPTSDLEASSVTYLAIDVGSYTGLLTTIPTCDLPMQPGLFRSMAVLDFTVWQSWISQHGSLGFLTWRLRAPKAVSQQTRRKQKTLFWPSLRNHSVTCATFCMSQPIHIQGKWNIDPQLSMGGMVEILRPFLSKCHRFATIIRNSTCDLSPNQNPPHFFFLFVQ